MTKNEIETRLREVRKVIGGFAEKDALGNVGSNEPLASDRVRKVFAEGGLFTSAEIIRRTRIDGYVGPDSRIEAGIRRLFEAGALRKSGHLYLRP